MPTTPTPVLPTMEAELVRDEGYRSVPYKDSLGNWACGCGCDLKAHGLVGKNGLPLSMAPWSNTEIYDHLREDIADAQFHLFMGIPWAQQLDVVRGRVLLNMCFNMGWLSKDGKHGLGTFTATLPLIQAGHYPEAAAHMLASAWAGQVGTRAMRLAARMATGDYNATWAPGQVIAQAALAKTGTPIPQPTAPDAAESPSMADRIISFFKRL